MATADSLPARSLREEIVAELGRDIYKAEIEGRPLRPISTRHQNANVADAYAIQQEYARLRTEGGAQLIGHKIGATSEAIQHLFQIDTPDYGHLFDDMFAPTGAKLDASALIQPMAEPEIGFILGQEVQGPGLTRHDILDATKYVFPCLEIIDSRIENWQIGLVDTVADNGSSARFVVGDRIDPAGVDLIAESVNLYLNDTPVETGTGAAVLGDPAASAAWLANALGSYGVALLEGAYLLSGSMTTAVRASSGDKFRAEFSSIGAVSCSFE